MLRALCTAHVHDPQAEYEPIPENLIRVSRANTNLPPNETPYPDDLIELLEAFEWPRLVFPPLKRSGHIILDACAPQGLIVQQTTGILINS